MTATAVKCPVSFPGGPEWYLSWQIAFLCPQTLEADSISSSPFAPYPHAHTARTFDDHTTLRSYAHCSRCCRILYTFKYDSVSLCACDYECVFRTNSNINVYIFSGRWQRLLLDLNALLNYERDNDIISIGIICIYIIRVYFSVESILLSWLSRRFQRIRLLHIVCWQCIYASAKYIAAAFTTILYLNSA